MSDREEILEVFYSDIKQKERQLLSKGGIYPFLDNLDGFQVEDHSLDEEDRILLTRISERDKLEQEADEILAYNTEEGDPE